MKGLSKLYNLLVSNVKNNTRHTDYERVCKLSKQYRQLMTGEELDELIKQFNSREDDEQFKQRKKLTVLVTQSIVNKITSPERKVYNTQAIVKEAFYTNSDNSEDKVKRLNEVIKSFYNEQGIDAYLRDHLFDLYDIDPNAFILYLFNNYDNRIERPVVYGMPIYSDEALNFEYVNNQLDWLIFRKNIEYDDSGKMKSGYYYSIISEDEQVSLTQVSDKSISGLAIVEGQLRSSEGEAVVVDGIPEGTSEKYYTKIGKEYYAVIFASPKAGFTPAKRVGNIPDNVTKGRTVVNNWHNALPYLIKSVKTCSELDITESLHVFAQTFEYQPRCTGQIVNGNLITCNMGQTPDGKVCSSCGGTGYQANKSGQDKIVLSLPRNPTDIFDLKNLKAYITAPIDILDRLVERLESHERKAIEAVYNSNRFIVNSAVKTATESNIDYQSIYDALKKLMDQYSAFWVFTVKVNAAYNDIANELSIKHIFGNRLGFESEMDIINKIQAAKNAGVSSYVLEQMNNDLIYVIYADYPDLIKRIETKQKFYPFEGKDAATINLLISQGLVNSDDVILYANFKRIFDEIEYESPEFYMFSSSKQLALIKSKIAKLKEEIGKQQQVALRFNDSTGVE